MFVLKGTQFENADFVKLLKDPLLFNDLLKSLVELSERERAAEILVELASAIHNIDEIQALRLFRCALNWQPSSERIRAAVYLYLEISDDPMQDFINHFHLQKSSEFYLLLLNPELDGLCQMVTLAHFLIFANKVESINEVFEWIKERLSMYPSNTKALDLFNSLLGNLRC